jgi:hypothetical protein
VGEHLPSKYKALISNSSAIKKKLKTAKISPKMLTLTLVKPQLFSLQHTLQLPSQTSKFMQHYCLKGSLQWPIPTGNSVRPHARFINWAATAASQASCYFHFQVPSFGTATLYVQKKPLNFSNIVFLTVSGVRSRIQRLTAPTFADPRGQGVTRDHHLQSLLWSSVSCWPQSSRMSPSDSLLWHVELSRLIVDACIMLMLLGKSHFWQYGEKTYDSLGF